MERRLEKAYQLTENWSVVSEQVKEKYSLSNIELDRVLAAFIKDPLDTLAGFIFSDLFDVLRSNISIDEFSINSTRLLTRKASELFKRGYSRYICLKLLLFLNGSELFTAFSPDSSYDADAVNGTPSLNRFDEPPQIKRTEQLVFEYSASCGFLSSRMITYSPVLEKYVALRCDHYPFNCGGFGGKTGEWGIVEACSMSKKVGGHPVLYKNTRQSNNTSIYRHFSVKSKMKVGGTNDGKILAWDAQFYSTISPT